MVKGAALFDTNILIDLFSGRIEAKHALEAYPPQNAISLITWMEVMVGAKKYHQENRTRIAFKCVQYYWRNTGNRGTKRHCQAGVWHETPGCDHPGHCSSPSL